MDQYTNISIFCQRKSWHKLITNVIAPFLTDRENIGLVTYVFVALSNNQGEHLIIEFKKNEFKKIKVPLIGAVTNFLKINPSRGKRKSFPLADFFMDYPIDTICIDIENFDKKGRRRVAHLSEIEKQLSDIIIGPLSKRTIDLESIYTVILYLQLGIIKAAFPELKDAKINMKDLLTYLAPNDSNNRHEIEHFKESLIENNKVAIALIVNNIWSSPNYHGRLIWMDKWIYACNSLLGKMTFKQAFVYINNAILLQFGFNETKLLYLSVFVINSQ